jgi:beta-lactamase regulating signal transducer with metallopeptidase domain
MESILTAFLNGAVACVPLVAAVWIILRFSKGWLNAATRYSIWWIVLAVVILAPGLYLPRAIVEKLVIPMEMPLAPVEVSGEALPATVFSPAIVAAPVVPLNLNLSRMFVVLWAFAAALMLMRLLFTLVLLHRRKSYAAPAGEELDMLVERCLARCGVRRRVHTGVLDHIASPMVAGPFRACMLIPARLLTALSADEMELICLHEAAHLARFDDAALLLQRVLQAALVWNPLVHWISRQIDREREIACDDFVIAMTGEPRPYASCLTHVAEVAGVYRISPLAAAATDGRSHLSARVELLLDKTRRAGARLLTGRFASFAAVLVLAAFVSTKLPAVFAFAAAQKRQPPVMVAQVREPKPAVPLPAPRTAAAPVAAPVTPATVKVFVTVTDPLHRFVTGLDRDVFKVFEQGTEQQISRFNGEDQPVSIWIVWNVGRVAESQQLSLARQTDAARASGQELKLMLSERNPQDTFSIIPVDAESLRTAGDEIRSSTKERKAVVIVSGPDGNSASLASHPELVRILRSGEAPIYSIGVGASPATVGVLAPTTPMLLAQAVNDTGGQYLGAADLDNLPAVVMRLVIEMRNLYELEYSARQRPRNGITPAVEVTIAQPGGLPTLTAHSRVTFTSLTQTK